jgi:hypothetical protein
VSAHSTEGSSGEFNGGHDGLACPGAPSAVEEEWCEFVCLHAVPLDLRDEHAHAAEQKYPVRKERLAIDGGVRVGYLVR